MAHWGFRLKRLILCTVLWQLCVGMIKNKFQKSDIIFHTVCNYFRRKVLNFPIQRSPLIGLTLELGHLSPLTERVNNANDPKQMFKKTYLLKTYLLRFQLLCNEIYNNKKIYVY